MTASRTVRIASTPRVAAPAGRHVPAKTDAVKCDGRWLALVPGAHASRLNQLPSVIAMLVSFEKSLDGS